MGAEEKSPVSSNSMQRVKVYRLNDDGKWDDQGTGHVSVDYLERSEELGLFVVDEEDNETLLMHRISPDDIYRKQEDTIISWRDPELSTELALSFQETAGCSYIWDNISNLRRTLHFSSLNSETYHSLNSELRELPSVELSTLPLILKIVTDCGIADQMRLTELILHDQDFFRKLMELFRICEDLENVDSLQVIYKTVKGIILLNSQQIFEKIFGDDLIMDIIGCLEYDPLVPHLEHRRFLKEHVIFKEAIPIKDPVVLSKVHQTYRIGYLKDVVLPRVSDEATVATLNSMIHANNAFVVSLLKDDNTFIQELFSRLKSSSTSAESKKNLVYFLHEFCSLSKSLQMVQQLRLFRDLVNEGMFEIIIGILQSQDKRLVLTGTDILMFFMNQDPNLLRSFVVRPEGIPLLGLLVQGMITDFGDDMHCQFLEILRSLLDSYTLTGPQVQGTLKDTIVEIFYEKHLGQLIDVITSSCPEGGYVHGKCAGLNTVKQPCIKPEILLNICELLCFCVLHHPYRIKCNFLLNNYMDKVLYLTRRREQYLVVAAVRFIRTIISRTDEHVSSYIVKHNILKPIVDVFVANGDRYNLLNSAVLELFEYIRKENIKTLVKYVFDSFWDQLSKYEHWATLQGLKVKHEQSLDTSGNNSSITAAESRKRVDERALEKEEEDYFNEDSDEEDTASASMSNNRRVQAHPSPNGAPTNCQPISNPKTSGLVDYDDDEDDEDYKPPPRRHTETSDADEGVLDTLSLKRKTGSKGEIGQIKKQRIDRTPKSKDSVFAALCSTLSHAVLPSKKSPNATHITSRVDEAKNGEKENNAQTYNAVEACRSSPEEMDCLSNDRREEDNHNHINRSDEKQSTLEDGHLEREDCPSLPPNSSPEMAVNGS
ncbi:hypothetical protein V2J09_013465 [Rumex salicifolius]